jgi:hypothetical protein
MLTQLVALALVENSFLPIPVLFIELTPNPMYLETGLQSPLCIHSSIEYRRTEPHSYKKKDDEPLLNLTGAMRRCSREKVIMCTQTRELESPL